MGQKQTSCKNGHIEPARYLNNHCILCTELKKGPYTKEERRLYMHEWRRIRKLLGKPVDVKQRTKEEHKLYMREWRKQHRRKL